MLSCLSTAICIYTLNSSLSSLSLSLSLPLALQPSRKGRKYAIGVIVCLSEMSHLHIQHFKDFIFSHFTLIDTHLERLKEGMEDALLTRVEPQRQNIIIKAVQVCTVCNAWYILLHVVYYVNVGKFPYH